MRNERGFTLIQLLVVLFILSWVVAACVYAYKNAPPPGPVPVTFAVGAVPATLAAGGTATVSIMVIMSGPAPAGGQNVDVRVLEADYLGDDVLYARQSVFVPAGATVGNATVTLVCDANDRSLRAPPGLREPGYSDNESQWDVRVIPYYGAYPQSNDATLICPGE